MLSVSFVFEEKELDDAFFRLDALIDEAAAAIDGFAGKESWVASDGGRRCSVYYWRDRDALTQFARHPSHIEAKRQYERWYAGFHIVIAEVMKSYGDGRIDHPTPYERQASR